MRQNIDLRILKFAAFAILGLSLTHLNASEHNRFKALLQQGNTAIGTHLTLSRPEAAERLAQAGFNWLFLDLENTPVNPETLQRIIQATRETDTAVIARIAGKKQWLAKPVLDMGAMGVVMPGIRSRQDAVNAMQANQEKLAMILIEHIDAVEKIDEILSVPGVDVVLVGSGDLAASMGLLGQRTHPRVEAAIQKVRNAAQEKGVPTGALAYSSEEANRRINQGFQAILIGHDIALLRKGALDTLSGIER